MRPKISELLFIIVIIILITLSVFSFERITTLRKASELVEHTNLVKQQLNEVYINLLNAETGQRGYLLSKDHTFLIPFLGSADKIKRALHRLDSLISDNEKQRENAEKLSSLILNRYSKLDDVLKVHQNQDITQYLKTGKQLMDEIRVLIAALMKVEEEQLLERTRHKDRMGEITPIFSLLLSVLSIIIVALAYFRLKQETRLRISAESNEERVNRELFDLSRSLIVQNETFKQAEESSRQGSYSFNPESNEWKFSDNLFRLLGYEPGETKSSLELLNNAIHPDDKRDALHIIENILPGDEPLSWTYRMISQNGTMIFVKATRRMISYGSQKFLVGTIQDVSDDVMLKSSLQNKNLELEQSNSELASFSYVASHDLQEPLRKIQTFSGRILEKEHAQLSDAGKDYFNRIISASQRMQNLIHSLLNFSQANSGESVFSRVDLNEILAEVENNFKDIIIEKNARIEADTLPVIKAVPVQMQQLFNNLVGNALKYAKPGEPPLVRIKVEKIHPTGRKLDGSSGKKGWQFYIIDNGIGFEQKYEHRIFQLFQRLHGRSEFEGTGIGLAICQKIVHLHGGTISAQSIPGKGATFTFFLPEIN